MKKDIPVHKVEDLAVAIAPRKEDEGDAGFWDVFIINLKEEKITDVIVNSRGYGEIQGEQRKTNTFRFYFPEIPPLAPVQIEPIQTSLFHMAHEFWISFKFEDYLYDKKYVFVEGSITEEHFTPIPFLDRKGVMIR